VRLDPVSGPPTWTQTTSSPQQVAPGNDGRLPSQGPGFPPTTSHRLRQRCQGFPSARAKSSHGCVRISVVSVPGTRLASSSYAGHANRTGTFLPYNFLPLLVAHGLPSLTRRVPTREGCGQISPNSGRPSRAFVRSLDPIARLFEHDPNSRGCSTTNPAYDAVSLTKILLHPDVPPS
jgi:hypothetical protein